jgi:hypothetical protein
MDPLTMLTVEKTERMTKHSMAQFGPVKPGTVPTFDDMSFAYGSGHAEKTLFGGTLWAMDGIAIGDTMYYFMLNKGDIPEKMGIYQCRIPIVKDRLDYENYTMLNNHEVGLYRPDLNGREARLSCGILDNTKTYGGVTPPHADEYIYIYGTSRTKKSTGIIVGRVKRNEYPDFSKWSYWNGSKWLSDFEEAYSNPKSRPRLRRPSGSSCFQPSRKWHSTVRMT